MMTKLIFVRHGHSEANDAGIFGGHCDFDLTKTGYKQAEIMARYVLENYTIDAVCASDLKRAVRTAETVAKPLGLPIEQDSRLREIYGGIWEGMTFDEIASKYEAEFLMWKKDISKVQSPGGENIYDLQKRAKAAIVDIAKKYDGKTVLIVAHRVLLRTLQCLWNNIPAEEINKCQWLSNCSVSEVLFDGDKFIPVNVGQDDFLKEYLTTVNTLM